MMLTIETTFKAVFIAAFFSGLSASSGVSSCASCNLKTRCLNDAISCLTGKDTYDQKLKKLETEVAKMKAQLAKAGQPGGFAMLDNNGRLPQNLLVAGYDRYSAYDLTWQSLHMAAAAACRGSTATGGKGGWGNAVLVRNTPDKKTCAQICAQTIHNNCDAEVSIYGKNGKATQNGQIVGYFYNYDCNHADNGGSEVSVSDKTVMNYSYAYFSFCCCRK